MPDPTRPGRPLRRRAPRGLAIVAACVGLLAMASSVTLAPAGAGAVTPVVRSAATSSSTPYPVGVFDLKEPSYLAPPPVNAMPGYARTYVDDFNEPLSPQQWYLYNGVPKGDPDGRFSPQHVAVNHGELKIGTWRDPRFGNDWVSGGAGLYGLGVQYGAFFIRSRETVAGPDTVALLWPTNNQWPPELDINEAYGNPNQELWFDHYEQPQDQVLGHVAINVTHWHTWGVIWTPQSVTFTVDGRAWGSVTSSAEIPTIPMELGLQSQAWCGIAGEPCPTAPSTYQVDWVAVYQPTST